MSLSKMFYSFIAACLLTFNHAAHAAVHDFGNVQAFDSAPFSQLALTDINFETQFGQVRHSRLAENDWAKSNFSGLSEISLTNLLYSTAQGNGGEVSTPPATSYTPEPESYAMIVAGLGLIVFTARHRK